MSKLDMGPKNLNLLYDEKCLKNLFLKINYKDSYITSREKNPINSPEYKLESFKGNFILLIIMKKVSKRLFQNWKQKMLLKFR